MTLEQTVHEMLSEIGHKLRVETRNSYPDTTQLNKDILCINRYFKLQGLKPDEKQINSISKIVTLLKEYLSRSMNLDYINESKEISSTGSFEKSITSGAQLPILEVLDELLGKELSAINNAAEMIDDFYRITEKAKNEDMQKKKSFPIKEWIKEIYLSKGRKSQLGTLNVTGGTISAIGIAGLLNYIPELREGFETYTNNFDLIKDIAPFTASVVIGGAGYYISTKAKKVGKKVKEIFKDINKILPKINAKKIEDQSDSIDKLNKYSYWGSLLTSLGIMGTTIIGKEIYDSVQTSMDNAEAIKYALPFITSGSFGVYGAYLLKKSRDLTKIIETTFNRGVRNGIGHAYATKLAELEDEGLLRLPANFAKESKSNPTEIKQSTDPNKKLNLVEVLDKFGYRIYDKKSKTEMGGYGEVITAYNKRKAMAVKALFPSLIKNNKTMITKEGTKKVSDVIISSFENEFGLLKRLSGCSLVPVAEDLIKTDAYGNTIEEGNSRNVEHMAITMEYIRGPTLENITNFLLNNSARLDGDETARKNETFISQYNAKYIAKELAGGLQEIHDEGIIHKDIKPRNVMLEHNGEVKLLDFGIAGKIKEDSYEKSIELETGAVSHLYSSPEQIISKLGSKITFNSDIHQFGQMLYQVLTNVNPFINEDVFVREDGIKEKLKGLIGLEDYHLENYQYNETEKNKIVEGIMEMNKGLKDEDKTKLRIRCNNVLDGYYKMPRSINPNISKEMEEIVVDCLKVNPNDRKYKTMKDINESLDRIEIYGHKSEVISFIEKVYSKFPAKLRN